MLKYLSSFTAHNLTHNYTHMKPANKRKPSNDNRLIDLRDRLPLNYIVVLDHKTPYSRSFIQKVILGERFNQDIIDAAEELAKEWESKKAEYPSIKKMAV